MSLRPSLTGAVPASTAMVARAAFPRGNPYLRLRDILGPVFTDEQFAALFPSHGQPAEAPWRLALVTLLQFAENLSDRRAAHAARSRIDWKYLLGLELADPGFDASVLSEFRSRLVAGGAEALLLDTLLALCRERKLLASRGRQRTDSTHVLGAVRSLNRLGCVIETLRAALNALAIAAPEWLRVHADPAWTERYAKPADDYDIPLGEAARRACAEGIGRDGHALLAAIAAPNAPAWLREVPAVRLLRRVWIQNFLLAPAKAGEEQGTGGPGEDGMLVRWRTAAEGFPTSLQMVASPYDPEVHYAKKRSTTWIGYKVHFTEACDAHQPRLVTHADTTPANVHDMARLAPIHAALAGKGLLPREHLVDAGYVSAGHLAQAAKQHGVALVGPGRKDVSWQRRTPGAFQAGDFAVAWDERRVRCPEGKESVRWGEFENAARGRYVKVRFKAEECLACGSRARCTRSMGAEKGRQLLLQSRDKQEALAAARARQGTDAGQRLYAMRQGIEATFSQGVRAFGLRRARYCGLAKTRLQHVATAAALNLDRVAAWMRGRPVAPTRTSRFTALAA